MAVPDSPPPDQSDNFEKKASLPGGADLEGISNKDDPLALLSKIETSSEAHPLRWPLWKKWSIVFIYCLLQVFVTLTSTTYVSVEFLIMEKWTSSTQVATLGQSMFIVGTAVGPAFLGPLSDINGRKWVYVGSIALYAILNIGTALADNFPMLVIFCFLTGCAGSVALCNVAGTIADLFGDTDGAAQPMALFVLLVKSLKECMHWDLKKGLTFIAGLLILVPRWAHRSVNGSRSTHTWDGDGYFTLTSSLAAPLRLASVSCPKRFRGL